MASNFAAPSSIAANTDVVSKENGLPATDGVNGNSSQKQTASGDDVQRKYKEERDKRVRSDGMAQYMDPRKSAQHSKFAEDPWVDPVNPDLGVPLPEGSHFQIVVVGTGFSGIFYAIHLLKAGFRHGNIRMVDTAGGFGGTWYWNRYPGLMCDTESYIYLPWLEEMGYVPKDKYATGEEIRLYTDSLAKKFKLHEIASFRIKVDELQWNADKKEWDFTAVQKRGKDQTDLNMRFSADFTLLANGVLNFPKLPAVPGIETFQGSSFHTARWDYEATGGSPQDPRLTKLEGKTVAIVGTGATGIQAVPQLAKWAKHLYVIQRTPSAIDVRNNRPTDLEEFKQKVARGPGWQRERQANFNDFLNKIDPPPAENMVNDGWTYFPSYSALLGTPATPFNGTMESIGAHLAMMHGLDRPRMDGIRSRVDTIVKDTSTAESLKPWYAGWCKRPCFHDDYLSTFNLPNVTLLDTAGTSISSASESSIVVNGKDYPVDAIVWSTGFNADGMGDPSQRADMRITGVDGVTMTDLWKHEPTTIHGVVSRGFPNLFFPGPIQSAAGVNFSHVLDIMAEHGVLIIAQALARKSQENEDSKTVKVVVQPSEEGAREWGDTIAKGAALFAALIGCTPSYINREGEVEKPSSPEEQGRKARGGTFSGGFSAYVKLLEAWRGDGKLKGMEVV